MVRMECDPRTGRHPSRFSSDPDERAGDPNHVDYDVHSNAGFKAWEEAWADHLGRPSERPLEVERRRGGGEADMSPEAVEERRLFKARHAEAMAYVASYRGTWGLPLDIRADRRWGSKYLRLSVRQVDALLTGKARDAEREQSRRESTPPTATATVQPSTSEGWYVVDGVPWKVQKALHGSHVYAKRLDLTDGKGDWTYVPGGIRIIAQTGRPMTMEEAAAFGRLYGICAICGRTLTDEASIAAGIGPVCASKL